MVVKPTPVSLLTDPQLYNRTFLIRKASRPSSMDRSLKTLKSWQALDNEYGLVTRNLDNKIVKTDVKKKERAAPFTRSDETAQHVS